MLDPNKPLYKYMKSEFAQKVISEGTFRIGTLYEFQNEEKHGAAIGDSEEGTKYVRNGPNETYDYSVPGSVPAFVKNFIRAEEGMHVKIEGIQMQQTVRCPDFYLYCVTSEVCPKAMAEFECDTVIKISEPVKFFSGLADGLLQKVKISDNFYIVPCIYRDRANNYSENDRTHPATIKDHRYDYQKEVRAIWEPTGGIVEPLIVQSKMAA